MMTELNRQIKRAKSKQKNVYDLDDRAFELIYWLIAAVEGCALFQLLITSYSVPVRIAIVAAAVLAGAVWGCLNGFARRGKVSAYQRQKEFEFIGLHDLTKNEGLSQSRDVLPRTDEIQHIKNVLETIIFPQTEVKQILCLTGQSGCGKSTILSFFKQAYQSEYEFLDFSGDYNYLDGRIEAALGSNPSQSLAQKTYAGKVIIILDQFERYFFLQKDKKAVVRSMIAKLGRKNSAVIVSMREEYLADFLKEFDMNNLKVSAQSERYREKGILRPLVSIIQDKSHSFRFAERRKAAQTLEWNGMRIKNNFAVHVKQADNIDANEVIERVGVTLFYCENQNEVGMHWDGETRKSVYLRSKCERVFADQGVAFFERHKDETLIEQQILYHMAEYDQKIRHASDEELKELFQMDNYDLMNRYFDIQLTASGDYFHASRILYLLSKARLHQVYMKKEDLAAGLFVNQFSRHGNERFSRTLDQLETIQLIRCSSQNSKLGYEIAHDFIAASFINYSNSNMDRSVRNALDTFMSEYLEDKDVQPADRRARRDAGKERDRYYKVINSAAVSLALVMDVVMRFIYNPWKALPARINPYGSYMPLFAPVITFIAIIYLGQMYDKVIKYYHGPGQKGCKILFIPLMLLAAGSQVCYPHIVMMDGICVAILGLNCAFLLDKSYRDACRSELRSYGLKCALIGMVFAFAHIMFCYFNPNGFPNYLMFAEAMMLAVLVLYSHIMHMSKEYLYARMMDASSERMKRGGESSCP